MIHRIAASALALCITQAFCLAGFAAEGVPQLLNYQGKLTNSLGKPVDGSKEMIFEFHDAVVDGNLLGGFSETQQVVVTKGVFNVLIGSATEGGVPASVFDGTSVYLSVKVEGEPLSPRQRIASVAYAFRSAQADDAGSLNSVPASEIQAALAGLQSRLVALEHRVLAPQCYVPAGEFKTSTGVTVYLDAYFIDTYEVTNEAYVMFLNVGGNDDHWRSEMTGEIARIGTAARYTYRVVTDFADRPVRWVSWYDATDFCAWRSTDQGLPAGTYRLPTEAEWEKAAGWGDPARTSLWTYAFQSDSIDTSKCNYNNSVGTTRPVGYYTNWQSYYGCYDMSGNLWEWCSDWFGGAGNYPSSTSNPTGPSSGAVKMKRGGSFYLDATYCRVDYRSYDLPNMRVKGYGFRAARTAQ